MKKTLWLYGDSFTELKNKTIPHDPWYKILAEKLGVERVMNRGESGIANTRIAELFWNDIHDHQPEDFVLSQLTESSRIWFFEDRPDLSNWQNMLLFFNVISKEQKNAVEQYLKYLDNAKRDYAIDRSIGFSLMAASRARSRVFSAFDEIPGQKGTLLEVSVKEFPGDSYQEQFEILSKVSQKEGYGDYRINHLSKVNHQILADKLYNWFTLDNEPLDFSTNFKEKIIQKDLLNV